MKLSDLRAFARIADLLIRVGVLTDSDLIARRLPRSETLICASPSYLAAKRTRSSAADLGSHRPINYVDRPNAWPGAPGGPGDKRVEFLPAAVVSDSAALLPMVLGGAGIARLPDFLPAARIKEGRLVRFWLEHKSTPFIQAIEACRPKYASSLTPWSPGCPSTQSNNYTR